MKKVVVLLLISVAMSMLLTACGTKKPQKIIEKEFGIDVSSGIEISNEDTHKGFHGDGNTYISLQFDDSSVLDAIKKDPKWKAFPLDKTIQTLVYGIEDDTGKIGPYLSDGQGNALVPKIQNGYYILIDHHSDTNKDILERNSFNCTVGLYDSDNNIIHFCKLDT